jgi:ATP-dependent Clp protease protease subunit
LIKQLIILDSINNDPIHLFINSPGGNVDDGFALIDIMKQCKSKIVTYAQGCVASMATLIFISGNERVCYKHSIFMFHDMFAGGADYSAKLKSRMEFFDKEYKVLENHILENTKLTPEDCQAMRNGELWLFADEAKAKKVTDTIL